MATVPTPTVGSKVKSTDFSSFILNPPRVYAYQTSTTTMGTSGTAALILFDTELYDTDTCHSTSSNTGRLTANATGLYSVVAQIGFAANSTGVRDVTVRKNAAGSSSGGTQVGFARATNTGATTATATVVLDVQLTSGDYLEMFGSQTSGGSLATVAGQSVTYFAMRWVANS